MRLVFFDKNPRILECKIFKSPDFTLLHFPPVFPFLPLRNFLNFLLRATFGFRESLADSFLESDCSSIPLEDFDFGSSEQYPSSPLVCFVAFRVLVHLAVAGMGLDMILGGLALVQLSILLEDSGLGVGELG